MATKTETPEEPIVAIYPVPGEIDEREKDRLPPVPMRIERERAKKAVATGAFSYEDATQTVEAIAERAPSTSAAKTEIAAAVKASEAKAAEDAKAAKDAAAAELKTRDERIAELEAQLKAKDK